MAQFLFLFMKEYLILYLFHIIERKERKKMERGRKKEGEVQRKEGKDD